MDMSVVRAVAFDCDGVLADAGSSWAVIHSHFGTGDPDLLKAFLNKELTDEEFMREDIRLWKDVQSRIHRDELFRCYSGVRLLARAQTAALLAPSRGSPGRSPLRRQRAFPPCPRAAGTSWSGGFAPHARG